jgi:hypothetical protein
LPIAACESDICNFGMSSIVLQDYPMSNRLWQSMAMRGWLTVCATLLTVLLLTHITSLRHKGLTTDEPLHYQYGYRVLDGTPRRTSALNASTMPFSSVHAMTSQNLALLPRTAGLPLDTFLERSNNTWSIRDHCALAITGAIRVEVEL